MLFAFQKTHTNVNLQSHLTFRRQFHVMDSLTKCLSGANFVDWSNTNVHVGLTSKLCLRPAGIQSQAFLGEPTLIVKKYQCQSHAKFAKCGVRTLRYYSNPNPARELQLKEKKHPPSVKEQQVTVTVEGVRILGIVIVTCTKVNSFFLNSHVIVSERNTFIIDVKDFNKTF